MDAAIQMILHPRATKPVGHASDDSAETYLRKCKQNIEAEVWSLVSSGSRQGVKVVVREDAIVSVSNGGVFIPFEQLRHNLLIFGGRLCLVTRARGDKGMGFEEGIRLSSGSWLIGYVKPYMVEYAVIAGYLAGVSIPSILKDVAVLTTRTPFAYAQRPFSDAVASNALQRKSVLGLQHTVEGIQGPPGTGKSSTIFHIVNSAMPDDMVAIVTCVQNRAVDALACKFQSSAIRFLVIGSPDRLGDTAKQHSLESLVEKDSIVISQKGSLQKVSRILDLIHSARRKRQAARQFKCSGWRRWWAAYSRQPLMGDLVVWSKLFEEAESSLRSARQLASDSISTDTTVFMCTVDALFRVGKSGPKRRILIIDEAGTVPDYKLPLAVSLGVEAVIAVGDQNQLQPFTHTDVPNGFFHRLAETISPSMLEEQFRMHPEISRFVSSSFYDHRLFTNPLTAEARCSVPLAGVHWIDYPDTNAESSSRNGAVCNHVELKMLKTFMLEVEARFLMHGKTVMIISFYREQHHLLMRMGEGIGLVGTRLEGTKTEQYFTHPNFRISTVDASQGSESDVVILSCVRCNAKNKIGFLSHPNRLCVALSRARERLIVLGSSRTLTSKNAIWKGLFNASQVGSSFQENSSIPFDLEDHVWETLQSVPIGGL